MNSPRAPNCDLHRRFCIISFTFIILAAPVSAQNLRMLYMAQAGYQPQEVLERATEFHRETGESVDMTFSEYEDQYALISSSAAGKATDFDIILLDLVWTADFASRGIIGPVPARLADAVREGVVPSIYRAFEYRGAMWGYPFLANFQLFYTNRDLLQKAGFKQPPATLEALVHMAEVAKAKGVAEYPIFESWKHQEVLICDFVWLVGAFGGNLTDGTGRVALMKQPVVDALTLMVDLLKRGLVNPYSLESDELFSADVFLWGDAMFSTNWTFILGRMDEIPFNAATLQASLIPVSQAVLDRGAERTSTVSGFQGLSVMRQSRRKDLAWRFVSFLSSPEFARRHLEEMPVWRSVWDEPWTISQDPYLGIKREELKGVHNRPAVPEYRAVSVILQRWIHDALVGRVSPRAALSAAQAEIDRLRSSERTTISGR